VSLEETEETEDNLDMPRWEEFPEYADALRLYPAELARFNGFINPSSRDCLGCCLYEGKLSKGLPNGQGKLIYHNRPIDAASS
jgi:hypothetical protein